MVTGGRFRPLKSSREALDGTDIVVAVNVTRPAPQPPRQGTPIPVAICRTDVGGADVR